MDFKAPSNALVEDLAQFDSKKKDLTIKCFDVSNEIYGILLDHLRHGSQNNNAAMEPVSN